MNPKDLIDEAKAAEICAISVSTLNRFIETGYLRVEYSTDGGRLFSKDELKRVFGIEDAALGQVTISDATVGNAALKVEPSPLEIEGSSISDANRVDSEKELHSILNDNQADLDDEILDDTPKQKARHHLRVASSHMEELLRAEVSKLKNVVTLVERLLEIRESEISSLKQQNSWLQGRIEKMEERSSREQLLLLAESETVRKLVTHQRRSTVRAALEWLGLAESTTYKSTIDIRNGDN